MTKLEHAWYQSFGWSLLLLPISAVFWGLSALRRFCFSIGLTKIHKLPVPVVVIGNINVGGNGKTPLVIYLSSYLKQQGFRPGIVSRGYGGKAAQYPMTVEKHSDPAHSGDEPLFIKHRVNCPVVVDPNRVRGAQALITKHGCNVILSDDGLQHYRLGRDIEIAVVDGQRRQGNGYLLPAGPLREGKWRLKTVDFVVVNGGKLQGDEYMMSLEPGQLVNVKFKGQTKPLNQISGPVYAAAGIGNPGRFFTLLGNKGVKLEKTFAFPDHHQYKESDLPDGTVLMTEKDAVKCTDFAKDNWWFLPVSAKLTETFNQAFLTKLKAVKSKK
ncbi:tetraacyldisaccharide 4'-kinase [Planctobacterium marinum]|uniref:Tetraacyldisaccharide 4'-kinase n=1 Tax=Planctobacterium marinum TaxID=1631968 RepID=A0AA48KSA0_9ALTE|nr:tetraacyldisaccharide 4'-kinase [Planctobacterium marinum]